MLFTLFQITSFFFFVLICSNALSYLALFEEKDYSAKRLLVHLRETKRGRQILIGKIPLIKWFVIFSYLATVFLSAVDNYYHWLVFALYLALFIKFLKSVFDREIVLPKFSRSAGSIFILSILFEFLLFIVPPLDTFLWLLILDKLLLLFITFVFVVFSVFFDFSRDFVINRAIEKISKYPKVFSIAVVGSYGRGSTKEFIRHVLALSYNVVTSRESFNDALGIAKTINSQLSQKSQIFIAEIEDNKKDDVTEMCGIINPKIVVVCGINEQKLSLFGSMDKIIDSKFAAVSSLSRDGIALFNLGSDYIRKLYRIATSKKFSYLASEKKIKGDIVATNIKEGKFSLSFDVQLFGKRYGLSGVKLLGRQNIENLLPAIFIGVYAGIDFSKIRRAFAELVPLPGSMEPKKAANGAILVNDTYNANINSVLRALSYMKVYRGKKVLVLEPLVEIGKIASQTHYDLGIEIGKVCDLVFLTNDNYYKSLVSGIKKSSSYCKFSIASPAKIINYVKHDLGREDVVVFEGHGASRALSGVPAERIY